MKKCGYCDELLTGQKTREHIIPNWYIDENNISFNERSKSKLSSDEIVIRDVCNNCNNVKLSQLDSYGKKLFDNFFSEPIFRDEKICFTFSYQLLAKWLLKMSYNSSRANKSDDDILSQYRTFLITDEPLPDGIMIFLSAITPSIITPHGILEMAQRGDANTRGVNVFRVGVCSFKSLGNLYWSFRTVIIHSYQFVLAVPDPVNCNLIKDAKEIKRVIGKVDAASILLNKTGNSKTKKPKKFFEESFMAQVLNNPVATKKFRRDGSGEEDENQRSFERLHDQDPDIFYLPITREAIVKNNLDDFSNLFEGLVATRENVLKFLGKCDFFIEGYDDDPRELFEIEEVREYLKRLDERFPYWFVLQSERGKWIQVMYFSLNKVKYENGKWRAEMNVQLIERWFLALNDVFRRCALPINKNRIQTELVIKLLSDNV